ncbi:MAG: hypothetical protein ACYSTT_24555 [Planctomycetota bacterium]
MAGPFRIECNTYTLAAKSKPVETASPVVAAADEPVTTRRKPPFIIIGILCVALAAAGMAIYKKKAAV